MVRSSNRPTVPPSFDVAAYARDSERKSRASLPASGTDAVDITPSEVRRVTRPHTGTVVTVEAWARTVFGTPVVIMQPDSLKRLPLDHRAGFVLSLIDGSVDLETLVDLSGMDRNEVLALVRHLCDSGIVVFQ
ncbi:MAG TPA: hypothetical protein VGY54_19380 [Polyangiaceae bacterium]|jgi:hypothetical protein|nr:hypothetical protein [Polyangiaceae bacterium]